MKNLFAPSARHVAFTTRLNRPVCDYNVTHRAKTQVFGCAAMDALIYDKYLQTTVEIPLALNLYASRKTYSRWNPQPFENFRPRHCRLSRIIQQQIGVISCVLPNFNRPQSNSCENIPNYVPNWRQFFRTCYGTSFLRH